jgi:predicted DNA-binding helix-hairpin-helix protein
MEKLNRVARILRQREGYRGYIHLKVIPGASDAAIEEAVRLSTAVSLNIEVPGAKHLARLSAKKDYIKDIIEPIKLISRLTGKGTRYERVKQTTQFIVGAAGETDAEIVKYMWGLYDRLGLQRVYFSAYQKALGGDGIPRGVSHGGSTAGGSMEEPGDVFMREHRLYQADFLIRKYGFKDGDILFEKEGNLSLECDPKEAWAKSHLEAFPVDVNRAGYYQLLRVPGLGPVTVKGILERRKQARLKDIEDIGKVGARLGKAKGYMVF